MQPASLTTTQGQFYLQFDMRSQSFVFDCYFNSSLGKTERFTWYFLEQYSHQIGFPNGPSDFSKTHSDPQYAQYLLEWVVNKSGLLHIPVATPAPNHLVVGGGSGNYAYPASFSAQWNVTTVAGSFETVTDYSNYSANDLTRMANVIREKTEAMEGMTKEIKELKEEIEDLKKDIQFYKDCEQDRP